MSTYHENSTGKGTIEFRRFNKDGELTGLWLIKNLVVTVGKALQANLLIAAGTAPSHIAIGTGVAAADAANTALGAETHRGAATRSRVTTTVTNDTSQFVYTFTFAGGFAITEAGLLNGPAGGDLLSRQVFAAINVVNLDSLLTTWKIQY